MDIEISDKILNSNNSTIRNNSTNNNKLLSNDSEQSQNANIFVKNKKTIYGQNQPITKKNKTNSGELTLCEGRLLNDLAEFKRSKIIGKICQIKLNDYIKTDNDTFEITVEFVKYFSVKFIFDSDYPCSPPSIIYYKGSKPKNIFDGNGNVLIESIKRLNWTPSIWLSTLVYSIELLISSGMNNENNYFSNYNSSESNQNLSSFFMNAKKYKYGKRKWDTYITEYNDYHSKESIYVPELEKNLKQLKIK